MEGVSGGNTKIKNRRFFKNERKNLNVVPEIFYFYFLCKERETNVQIVRLLKISKINSTL